MKATVEETLEDGAYKIKYCSGLADVISYEQLMNAINREMKMAATIGLTRA